MSRFILPIVAPKATAQQKGAFVAGGRVRFFKKAKVKQAENLYASVLIPHRPPSPMVGPVQLKITFVLPWNKSALKRHRAVGWMWKDTKPDVDNMAKALIDTMASLGFWGDDSQLCDVTLRKLYADDARIEVEIDEAGYICPVGETKREP